MGLVPTASETSVVVPGRPSLREADGHIHKGHLTVWTLAQSTQGLSLLPSTIIGVVLGIVVGAVGVVIITKIARVRTISDARREA